MMGSMARNEFREARQEVNQFNLLQLIETSNHLISDTFQCRYCIVKLLAFSQESAAVSLPLILKLV